MITRDEYDEHGLRYAKCERCGMGWIEGRESAELFPGEWTTAGERDHACPEPYPLDLARAFVACAVASGVPVHPRQKAACKLAFDAAGLS